MNHVDEKSEALQGNTGASSGIEKFGELDKTGSETLLALLQSKTNGEAARTLSIAESTLYQRIKRYNLDKIIEQFPKQALMRLQLGSTRAAEVLVEKLEKRDESLQAATQILDRVGLTGEKTQTLQQFNVNGEMTVEFVE